MPHRCRLTVVKSTEMTARKWAATIPQGGHVKWSQLQTAALAGYPRAGRRLGPLSLRLPVPLSPGRTRLRRLSIGAAVVVVLLVALSPFIGTLAALMAPEGHGRYSTLSVPENPDFYLPIAGSWFALTIVGVVVTTVSWWREGRTKSNGFRLYAGISAALAAVSVRLTAGIAADHSTPHWRVWEGVILIAAAVSVVSLVIQLVASKRGRAAEAQRAEAAKLTQLQRNVRELTPEQQTAIRQDLGAAIDDLRGRGIITEAEATRARGAELGLLTEVMAGRV